METIVAMFLLVAQILWFSSMVQQSRRTQRWNQMRHRATLLGQEKMDEIRLWAQDPAHFLSDWSVYNGRESVASSDPGLVVRVDCNPAGQPLFSPCFGLEAPYDVRAKKMSRSVINVRVTVIWDSSQEAARVTLCSLVGEPLRPGPYTLSMAPEPPFSQPVLPDNDFGFKVTALDGAGRPLQDLVYQWKVKPITGNATLLKPENRRMEAAKARHVFVRYGYSSPVGGDVELECRALYYGQLLTHRSGVVRLQVAP